ncbi:hypothetical protein KC349_g5614 [Hortaea werneckii]|nr:hypothetical protein KC349_g5614 [Hortaea werneckii]
MSLQGQNVLITGASMGIGRAIALAFAAEGANLALLSRSPDKLQRVKEECLDVAKTKKHSSKVLFYQIDLQDTAATGNVVSKAAEDLGIDVSSGGAFDILINNAGLALGAPKPFWEQDMTKEISPMIGTDITGFMGAVHAMLNQGGMVKAKRGTIVNVTSVTGLEVPPFPGETVYHSAKACQEGFTNVLRTELQQTNVRVLALRPGVVQTNFHEQRVGYDKGQYDDFVGGIEALVAEDVAEAAVFMVKQPERISVKALDVVPSSQRSLQVIDKTWEKRNAGA